MVQSNYLHNNIVPRSFYSSILREFSLKGFGYVSINPNTAISTSFSLYFVYLYLFVKQTSCSELTDPSLGEDS